MYSDKTTANIKQLCFVLILATCVNCLNFNSKKEKQFDIGEVMKMGPNEKKFDFGEIMKQSSRYEEIINYRPTLNQQLYPHQYDQSNQELFISQGVNACMFYFDGTLIDFTPFRLAMNVWPAWYYVDESATPPTVGTYNFTWCMLVSETDQVNDLQCNGDYYAVGSPESPFACQPYTGAESSDINATQVFNEQVTYNDSTGATVTKELNGTYLKYSGGDKCSDGRDRSFTVQVFCDPNVTVADTYYTDQAMGDDCQPYVQLVTSQGCNFFESSMIWDYLAVAEPYFGFVFIGVGALLCLFSLKLIRAFVCFAGLLTGIIAGFVMFYATQLTSLDDLTQFYIWVGVGAGIGLVAGCFLCICIKAGAAVLAAWGGAVGAMVLDSLFIYKLDAIWLFWTLLVVCGLVAGVLAFIFYEPIVIVSSASLGGWLLMRGIGCYAGHYYSEILILNMIKDGLIKDVDPLYWCYVAGWLLTFVLSTLFQCKMRPKKAADKDKETVDRGNKDDYESYPENNYDPNAIN